MADLRIIWQLAPDPERPDRGARGPAGRASRTTCAPSTWRCRRRTRQVYDRSSAAAAAGYRRRGTRIPAHRRPAPRRARSGAGAAQRVERQPRRQRRRPVPAWSPATAQGESRSAPPRGAAQRSGASPCSPPACSSAPGSPSVPDELLAGLPRIGEYFWRILPQPALAAPARRHATRKARLAYWFYRLDSLGLAAVRDREHGGARHPVRRYWRPAARLPRRAQPGARIGCQLAFRRLLEALPHRAGDRLRADPGLGLRRRPARRHPGDRAAHRGRLGKLFAEVVENADMRAAGTACARPAATGPQSRALRHPAAGRCRTSSAMGCCASRSTCAAPA